VTENELQFGGLNFLQRLDDSLKKLLWAFEATTYQRTLNMAKKPEVRRGEIGTICRMGGMQYMIFCDKLFGYP
jgi:hypothetical protein